jgi:ribosomal-protein-alanine N-acetyltransferase
MESTSLEVRGLTESEVDEAMAILALAYGAAATQSARATMRAAPGAWLIARHGGAAAGVVTSNAYGQVAYVAMLAVDPAHRRRGVATQLMNALLARLERAGATTVLLDATAQAEPLYRNLGFVEVDRTRVFTRPAPAPEPAAGPPCDVASDAFEQALRLDALAYGCDRSAALRDFANAPHAFLATEADGYALARGPILGPAFAERAGTAGRLFNHVLAQRPHIDRAFAPLANPAAEPLLEEHGFGCTRTLAHMVRGAPSPFRRDRIYSQASLGHG